MDKINDRLLRRKAILFFNSKTHNITFMCSDIDNSITAVFEYSTGEIEATLVTEEQIREAGAFAELRAYPGCLEMVLTELKRIDQGVTTYCQPNAGARTATKIDKITEYQNLVVDYIGMHTNVGHIVAGTEENSKDMAVGNAYWLLRMALQKRGIVFQGRKFLVIVPDEIAVYRQLIKIVENLKIEYTTFV